MPAVGWRDPRGACDCAENDVANAFDLVVNKAAISDLMAASQSMYPRSTKIVCVLGMHRSGTSLLMRLLNFLGVELGPAERLQGPTTANPTGYWEHRDIRTINDEILLRLGGSWRDPPAFPYQWEARADFDDLRAQATAIAERDFPAASTWGFKDPRTCLTLPFWLGLFPAMQYVLCIRHPVDVALSMENSPRLEYQGVTLAHALSLWPRYVAASIASTIDRRRCYVRYDDLIERPSEEIARVEMEIGLEGAGTSGESMRGVVAFVRPALRHHRSGADSAIQLPAPTQELLDAILASQRDESRLDELAVRIVAGG
jgi:hypothetical protein